MYWRRSLDGVPAPISRHAGCTRHDIVVNSCAECDQSTSDFSAMPLPVPLFFATTSSTNRLLQCDRQEGRNAKCIRMK